MVRARGIKSNTVSTWCRQNSIDYKFVSDLNGVVKEMVGIDLCVYTGGGILNRNFINSFKIGVLNCHSARLPEIRGMNSLEWSLYTKIKTYSTLHFITTGVDMGPIIKRIYHDYSFCSSIAEARGLSIVNTVNDLLHGVEIILSGIYDTTEQRQEEGKQYFTMHPILLEIVEKQLVLDGKL